MARHIHLAPHLAVDELARRYRAAKEPHERSWWQILWLLARGQTATQIAQSTGYSAYWIGQVAKRYNAGGPAAMVNRQHTHSRRTPPLLTPIEQEDLPQVLLGSAPHGGLWTGPAVAAWMSERLGRRVGPQRGWIYLTRLRQSPQVPRPRHTGANPIEQQTFKKSSVRSSKKSPRPSRTPR